MSDKRAIFLCKWPPCKTVEFQILEKCLEKVIFCYKMFPIGKWSLAICPTLPKVKCPTSHVSLQNVQKLQNGCCKMDPLQNGCWKIWSLQNHENIDVVHGRCKILIPLLMLLHKRATGIALAPVCTSGRKTRFLEILIRLDEITLFIRMKQLIT